MTLDPTLLRRELQQLQEEMGLMRKLVTVNGFIEYFFKELGRKANGKMAHRTQVECFNHCNERYYDLFGEYRYSDYSSFKITLHRWHRKS